MHGARVHRNRLPIDSLLPEILASLRANPNLVIEAAPGAGKTTRVTAALLDVLPGEVLVLEPRRIAARMAARRVAEEVGEQPGETVGYQVRFEEIGGPATRLRFLTDGVFLRRLLSDATLRRVSAVVLDEFHERRLETDLALALVRRLQQTSRPDLRIVVMSATLDGQAVADYLGCMRLRSEGRGFEVAIEYTPHSGAALEEQVARAVEKAATGDVLVFLPGAAEIRRAMRACEGLARSLGMLVLPLHGDLPPAEQDRATSPADRPKLILSTNVAESSITIDGVTTVIDSGLARIASDSPATGLPAVEVQRISRASAIQRAGRAGRTAPGRAIRLYSQEDFLRRAEQETPEIRRRELSQVVVQLRALGVADPPWFEAPPQAALDAASALLDRLGGAPKSLARFPGHPRLARALAEAPCRQTCRIAAALSAGERYPAVDALALADHAPSPLAERIAQQLWRTLERQRDCSTDDVERAWLAAFPDRVGRRRSASQVQLAGGVAATLEWPGEYLVALDVEQRREAGTIIRLACSIRPEWLLELFPERIVEREELLWNRTAERVESSSAMLYDDLILAESRTRPDPVRASEVLAAKAVEAGIARWVPAEDWENLLARAEYAALPLPDPAAALREVAEGKTSLAELRGDEVLRALLAQIDERRLREEAPERVVLRGRQVRVHYARGQSPWIASRLQDFFGLRDTPKIGRRPLLVHLLAPNQRAVQVTADLAGFWERLYPQIRKELMRRYPKHAWPEDPLSR